MSSIDNSWISEDRKMGLVSIIIPTYNREAFLEEALQSVINQTYRPVECIVMDDGSTDNTKEVANKYAALIDESITIKYFYQENSGSQVARNKGTLLSSGEYIQYLDSDDVLYPNKISSQVDFLENHTDCDGVFGNWRTGNLGYNEVVTAYAKEDMIDQILTERCIHTLSFLMRRSLVSLIGEWDIKLKRNQEIDFHLRGLLKGAKYRYISMETGLSRTHNSGRITTTTGTEEILRFHQKWENLLTKHKMFTDEMKVKFAKLYMWFFVMDIKKGPVTIELLSDAIRLDPNNPFFASKKLKLMRKVLGTKLTLRLWLSWLIYNRKKQQQSNEGWEKR